MLSCLPIDFHRTHLIVWNNAESIVAFFAGNSVINYTLPMPLLVTSTSISLYFKTWGTDAVIAYLGDPVALSDYLRIALVSGRVSCSFNAGGGPTTVASSLNVADGVWHSVLLTLSSTGLSLQLDNTSRLTSPNAFPTFTLLAVQSTLTLGASSNSSQGRFFNGALRSVKFDDVELVATAATGSSHIV